MMVKNCHRRIKQARWFWVVLDLPDQLTANFKTFDIKSMSQFESHTECVLPSKGRIFAKHKQLTMLLCLVTLA